LPANKQIVKILILVKHQDNRIIETGNSQVFEIT